ncbi:phosphatidate cytidylyltransferase [Snodgrassella alvi]|uniref:Phosphatidate cytidylyltransferase n=1 Tax=Snodgrassella alvi TaxID=1196083 RepID=A0A2N9Y6R1_9NEIS|nr:phosphatidate cytidylyltransferase [Snodgrassella alvi]PIT61264.1 phosphatidate cytidylyltransferase [Snodgrassella alvi]PIT64698.1 phosphatidate cytidylyltransferase [Snodgrassella alvi]
MLKQRILTALVLLPLMIGMLFGADNNLWAAFSGLISLLALWEYARIAHFTTIQNVLYLLVSAAGGGCLYFYNQQTALPLWAQIIVLLFWLIIVPVWLKFKWKIRANLLGVMIGWLLMVPFWQALIYLRPDSHAAGSLLSIMVLVWIADIAAYFVGRAVGKRKLAPIISPNKSWEGAFGAVICVAIYTTVLQHQGWLPVILPWWQTLCLAFVLTAVSICGDLLESWLKRAGGVKDSSQLLPGHGGVFDRVDSLIAVLSVYAALMACFGVK